MLRKLKLVSPRGAVHDSVEAVFFAVVVIAVRSSVQRQRVLHSRKCTLLVIALMMLKLMLPPRCSFEMHHEVIIIIIPLLTLLFMSSCY